MVKAPTGEYVTNLLGIQATAVIRTYKPPRPLERSTTKITRLALFPDFF